MAVELQKGDKTTSIIKTTQLSGPSQQRIDVLQNNATRDAYKKLMRTAYELTQHPTLSLSNFNILVKVQRANGVRLIQG